MLSYNWVTIISITRRVERSDVTESSAPVCGVDVTSWSVPAPAPRQPTVSRLYDAWPLLRPISNWHKSEVPGDDPVLVVSPGETAVVNSASRYSCL